MKRIVKKYIEKKDHCFDKAVYEKESAKKIADNFYEDYDLEIEDIDFISARIGATVGEDICNEPIRIKTHSIFNKDHYVSYRSYEAKEAKDKIILFIHGGGFITGYVRDKDAQCKYLAKQSQAKVLAIEYRLAPECMFPGALEDCLALVDHIRKTTTAKLIIGGDSAGANLAAVCCLQRPGQIDMAFLLYGAFDLERAEDTDYHWDYSLYEMDPKQEDLIKNRLLRFKKLAVDMKKSYIPEGMDVRDERISPFYAEDLSGMPKTLMIEAEFDYYRICNEHFAKKLYDAGVNLEEIFYEGVDHAFMDSLGRIPQAKDCLDEIGKAVREL